MPDLAAVAAAHAGTLDTSGFDPLIVVPRESWRQLAGALAARGVWFSDVTCMDRGETLEVVALVCASPTEQITLKTVLPDGYLVVDSLWPVWPGVDWLEREAYDMFGVRFTGHPDLTRILMYDGFEGHPLRKGFPLETEEEA
ncbi:MAG TPA: NADH-quinone oxidoreductase subunit C [Coriobacteriia bacterium]|jgi:NADH-quinone oxidoreductase subunit C